MEGSQNWDELRAGSHRFEAVLRSGIRRWRFCYVHGTDLDACVSDAEQFRKRLSDLAALFNRESAAGVLTSYESRRRHQVRRPLLL